jgi:phosphocarrier protein HPr
MWSCAIAICIDTVRKNDDAPEPGEGGLSEEHFQVVVTIRNQLGLHARAATRFVQLASKFPCEVSVTKDGQKVNGKSIMGVLMLVASCGTDIAIEASGSRAEEAGTALVALVESKFGEER